MTNIVPRSEATLRGDYVLLTADTLHLLLPRHEVGAAEYLEARLDAGEEPGLLRSQGGGTRVFAALSAEMTLLPHCPPERFLVATLGERGDDLGWCWNELKILIGVELRPQPLPPVLLAPETPVSQYVEVDGKLAYLCSADRVRSFALGA